MKQKLKELEEEAVKLRNTQVSRSCMYHAAAKGNVHVPAAACQQQRCGTSCCCVLGCAAATGVLSQLGLFARVQLQHVYVRRNVMEYDLLVEILSATGVLVLTCAGWCRSRRHGGRSSTRSRQQRRNRRAVSLCQQCRLWHNAGGVAAAVCRVRDSQPGHDTCRQVWHTQGEPLPAHCNSSWYAQAQQHLLELICAAGEMGLRAALLQPVCRAFRLRHERVTALHIRACRQLSSWQLAAWAAVQHHLEICSV